MPLESAHPRGSVERSHRKHSAGVSQPVLRAVPQLHRVSSESPRFVRGSGAAPMKILIALLAMAPAFTQTPAEPAKPAESTTTAAPAPAAADNPAPAAEPWITGSIDLGY